MLAKVILIIDKRLEMPAKYKKLLEGMGITVFSASSPEDGFNILYEYEPDMVLISDSIEAGLAQTCKNLRALGSVYRPIIAALSKSEDLEDKLAVLGAGADDFLSEPIESEEFKARINAHLRRHFENSAGTVTNLPDAKTTFRVLKRAIKENKNWAAMLIRINDFDAYREIYGELAADKMQQTFSAIVNSTLDESDFMGELTDGEFIVITNFLKAEHIASFTIYAFDSIVDKFYTENDAKQGYIILQGDDNAGKRITLASVSIGIISNEHKTYPDMKSAVNALIATYKLARVKTGSGYMIEHPKISAVDSVSEKSYNNRILIVEEDEALNLLLRTSAQMQGYEVLTISDYEKVAENAEEFMPALIILDAGDAQNLRGLKAAAALKEDESFKDIKIILSTVIHDKKLVLDAGADLYLPKPYEIVNIFNWVERLVREFNE